MTPAMGQPHFKILFKYFQLISDGNKGVLYKKVNKPSLFGHLDITLYGRRFWNDYYRQKGFFMIGEYDSILIDLCVSLFPGPSFGGQMEQ
jgi:hypothetical protein